MSIESRGRKFSVEDSLQLAIEAASIGVWELAIPSNEVLWSTRCNEIFGLPLEAELKYVDFLERVHEEDRVRVDDVIQSVLDPSGTGNYEIEYRIVRPNGEVRWVAAKGRVFFGQELEERVPYRFLGTLIDRTEHRQTEQARSHLAAIVESSHDAILSKDANGIVTSWNRGAQQMFGHSEDEIIGRPVLTLIPKDLHPEEIGILNRIRAGERIKHYETIRTRKNGEHVEVSITISPVNDSSGKVTGASTVIRDISQQKKAERRLRQAYKMEALGQLTGGIAHDFNNILAIMMGNLELIAGACSSDPLAKEKIQQTVDAAERAADLTRRLLAFARQQPLDPTIVNTAAVVNNAAEFIRSSLGATVLLQITIPPALWPTKIDKNQFENALLNLAVNARDAMPGGGRLYIDCQNVGIEDAQNDVLGALGPYEYVLISVRDTGTGMTAESLARATEPFFTTKPIGHGTGLGLSMVHGFIEQSGGRIRIDSQLSSGTTIHLYLPRANSGELELSHAPPALPTHVHRGAETILIVEDEPAIRTTLAYALKSLGYHVLDAEDGPSAIVVLRSEHRVDLLLTDITLPNGMNGVIVAEEAKALHPAIKVIFSSGYTSNVLIRDYKLAEGAHLVTKPARLKDLFAKIRNTLDESPT